MRGGLSYIAQKYSTADNKYMQTFDKGKSLNMLYINKQ